MSLKTKYAGGKMKAIREKNEHLKCDEYNTIEKQTHKIIKIKIKSKYVMHAANTTNNNMQ